ncbi:hypothetical protein PP175_27395 (plasmid) [Aneurinibacillus sp. Ricciae_BoGa-3]|uniref:hypothetical protein n=1 Tax=Aneurinibacillus sp. Ricciae_BoGa-3 TaxID=3022697 RepID=UPI0023423326|nr:hypothetical protein [Aneurinibacillus sp. Ricciae_BoGa-3]WCK56941.1 hypothetical protein PP175_27510 [Aneurinibacillus sp. Ricciae_BoGa-3]WCK57764.1 hypothetical protein PP175_27395 [Aneurinibacillus sp. Ricciae_BoGa-3]
MTAIKNKKFSMGIVVAMILALFMVFGHPIASHAASGAGVGDLSVSINPGTGTGGSTMNFKGVSDSKDTNAWNTLLSKYRNFIVGISGIGAVSMIAFFIVQFMKLGASAGNPQARSQALTGVLWTGLAAAGLGAVSIIVGFFYNSVN